MIDLRNITVGWATGLRKTEENFKENLEHGY
jgi:hypothetical protein